MLAALAFVPVPNVLDAFESLMETFPMEAIPVADYFEDNYIGRLRRNRRAAAMFPLQLWNVFDRVQMGLPRSNNSVEAWNRHFQSVVGCHHPSIWKFIDKLKAEQSLNERRIEQVFAGQPFDRKKMLQRYGNAH